MRLRHKPAAATHDSTGSTASATLATDVEIADTWLRRARGLMFRRWFPPGSALVFRFDRAAPRALHMLFVPFAIDALWVVDGEVVATKRLGPWVGVGRATAETIIELPAGAADEVAVGDRVVLE